MDDAAKTYAMNMEDFMAHRIAAQSAFNSMRSSYPMHEVDVGETVYVSIDEERHYDCEPTRVTDYIAELEGIAAKAPDGAQVMVEFERESGYDDDSVTIRKIGYWRDPTPKERKEREAHNAEAREHNAALEERKAEAERAEFERLKAKLGS